MRRSKKNEIKLLTSRNGKTFIDPITGKEVSVTRMFPLNTRYAVSAHGHVFDSFDGYGKLIPYKSHDHYFIDLIFNEKHDGVPFLLGEVVLSTFVDSYKIGDKFTYNTKSKHCSLVNLKHLPQGAKRIYPESELQNWDCYAKSNYANTRVMGLSATNFSIVASDVYECLLRTDFRCAYCGEPLLRKGKWHLDHVVPLSRGGTNDRLNITPACVECNLMKHSLNVEVFFAKILKIAHNMNLKNTGMYNILDFKSDMVASYHKVYLLPDELVKS